MRFTSGQRIDRYEIIRSLGEGAFAEIYQAKDTETGDTVVLKCPNPQLFADPGLFQRYRRETEIGRRLDHPGVQRSLDEGGNRTEPYLVLEYVDGHNLREVIRNYEGPTPVPVVVDWGHQLADALAYLHDHGIVHRDLKPENVLVTEDNRLKIADFGTAMLEGARRLTWKHLSENLGTPDYMSPEQVQGERGTPQSDIYAWGVMMYELLTGHVPYGGDNYLAVMAGHMQGTPRRILEQRDDVPAALEAIVLRAMRRYPENRYASAADIVSDLDHLSTLDVGTFDLTPEKPLGGMASAESQMRLWMWTAKIAIGFILTVAVIIGLSVALR